MNWLMPCLLAETVSRATYDVGRLEELRSQPVVAGVAAAVLLVLLAVSWLLYVRESVALSPATAGLLAALRSLALIGVVVLALDITKRESREVTERSRVVVLVDTSQSMGLPGASPSAEAPPRGIEVAQLLDQSPLLLELQKTHLVEVVHFADRTVPVASVSGLAPNGIETPGSDVTQPSSDTVHANSWRAALEPTGSETRLGDALQFVFQRHVGLPLAGIIVLSDGGQNAGSDPVAAAEAAKSRQSQIHTIGFGALALPPNLAVREFLAPKRAYPGDRMTIIGVLEAHDLGEKTVQIELLRQPSRAADAAWESIAEQQVALDASGTTRVEFVTTPSTAGQFLYELRAVSPTDEKDVGDNVRQADVTVVDRKLRVLMFAGGPSREYQFLRNQLQRDKNVSLDVLLQSAGAGAAQDAENVLTQFPNSSEELYQYDVIVAFDPDWSQLDAAQANLLEAWIAEQAGGMIVSPGLINTGRWMQNSNLEGIRALYPVIFDPNEVLFASNTDMRLEPRPLELTREGAAAEFLRLHDDASESAVLWTDFPGVYGDQPGVVGTKPGATVYARLGSIGFDAGQEQTVFLAEQFYGSGRVFYENSAELWRLRTIDPALFERLFARLIQHVAQGRLHRGSSRGSLLVERERYHVGETVVLRARLVDPQLQPLAAESVEVQVLQPDEHVLSVRLQAEANRQGQFIGEFRAAQAGEFTIRLAIPDSKDELSERITVAMPALEQQPLIRDEKLLKQLAQIGGGYYYPTSEQVLSGSTNLPALIEALPDLSETRTIYSQPDDEFAEHLRMAMLLMTCGALFTEWVVRRWNRLA